MSMSEAFASANFKPEKNTGKRILVGTYKAALVEVAAMEDKGYGPSIMAKFKVAETLEGQDSNSQYPEFTDYYNTSPEKITSKRNGLAKLINGLYSAGIDVDTSSDDKIMESLDNAKGAEVYISAYSKKPMHQVDGEWEVNEDADPKQAFTFITEKAAVAKAKKAEGSAAPF